MSNINKKRVDEKSFLLFFSLTSYIMSQGKECTKRISPFVQLVILANIEED